MSIGKKLLKGVAITLVVLSLIVLVTVVGLSVYANKHISYALDDALFASAEGESVIRLYTKGVGADGEPQSVLFEEVYLGEYRKDCVDFDRVPDTVRAAFLAAEDRRFYEHHGVNVGRTVLAAVNALTKRSPTFGASTITQQVVKNISGDNEVTFQRKLSEILRAIHMEQMHSKDEIFSLYLNIIPMSENILGIAKASEVYFGKEVETLTYTQAATLAGIANAPTRYNPYLHPEECLAKRNRVLYAMMDAGYLTEDAYEACCREPLGIEERRAEQATVMSWFAETVLKEIEADLVAEAGMSAEAAHRYMMCGGFSVETTVDPEVQAILTRSFEDSACVPTDTQGLSYAMCICDSMTGELVAIVGRQGEKTGNRLSNLASDIPHTPGSSLKPLALYAPLLNEKRIHAATVFDDVPTEFHKSGATYTAYPRNSPGVYQGLIPVCDALRLSKNTVALRLYAMRGAEAIYHTLRSDFDFDTVVRSAYTAGGSRVTDLAPAPLALGQLSYGVTLRKLTEAYTVFPSEGIKHEAKSYRRVWDGQGHVILEKKPTEKRVYSEECARIMNQMLSGVTESGTAKRITLKYSVDTAGKTGTSGNDRDRWFIGYTPYYTAGIWCGYENGAQAIGASGRSHLDIWDEVMRQVHASCLKDERAIRAFSTEGLIRQAYCKDSGERFTPTCAQDPRASRMAYGYFTPDNQPSVNCERHVLVPYDSLTSAVAHDGCPSEDVTYVALLDIRDRSFPCEVYVSDAQYVYRPMPEGVRLGESYDCPYFVHALEEGRFCGISIGKKQFNAACYWHDEEGDGSDEDISST